MVKQVLASLIHELYKLPTEGPLYTSIHPAWCFFMACVATQDKNVKLGLMSTLNYIMGGGGKKSVSRHSDIYSDIANISENVNDVCTLVRWMWDWQVQDQNIPGQKLGWWDRMTEHVEGNNSGHVICLA